MLFYMICDFHGTLFTKMYFSILQRGPNGQSYYVMRRNFHIPPEEELRRMVTPETVRLLNSLFTFYFLTFDWNINLCLK